MSFSIITKDGVVIGTVVFDLFCVFSHWMLVALLSDIALRTAFRGHIGLYMVVKTSVVAGLRACTANHQLHSPSATVKIRSCFLFFLALLMTRGIDFIFSGLTSFYLSREEVRQVFFVTAANTELSSVKHTCNSSNAKVSIERTYVYQALYDITENATLTGTWPESIGHVSDAEVAAITLAGKDVVCMDSRAADQVKKKPEPSQALRIGAEATNRGLSLPHPLVLPLFGEGVRFAELFIKHPSASSEQFGYGYTIPISTSYYIPQDGRSPTSDHSRQQFGVISMPNGTLGSYDMECGLDMYSTVKWFEDNLPRIRGVRVRFDDIHDEGQKSVTAATFTVSRQDNQVEVLSLGAGFSQRSPSSEYNLQTVSLSKSRGSNSSAVPVTTSFDITSESFVTVSCTSNQPQRDRAVYPRASGVNSSATQPDRRPSAFPTTQECIIKVKNSTLSEVKVILTESPTSPQICRTRVRRYDAKPRGTDEFSHFASARYVKVTDRSTSVACINRDKETQRPISPILPLALLSGKWGFVTGPTVQSSQLATNSKETADNGHSWHVSLVLLPWWLLGTTVAAACFLRFCGEWCDLAEVVAIIMYSFAFRPTPPAVLANMQNPPQPTECRAKLLAGLSGIPLNQHAQFALVQLDNVQDPQDRRAPLEIRIVPASWKLNHGDNISLAVEQQESVLEVSHSFLRLMAMAKKMQGDESNARNAEWTADGHNMV